jgi:serine protease
VVVASAGNDNTDASFYSPAGEDGVVTVSAVDLLGQRASYSNYGSVIDVAAPGGDETTDENGDGVPDGVLSLVYSNNGKTLYQPYEGTSMASRHVSGIIALMKSVYPAMTPDIVDSMLAGTAGVPAITQDVGTKGLDDEYGYGLLNANLGVLSSLQAASKPTTTTPLLQLSTTTLDFGPVDDTRTFDITNAGRGTLTVTSTADDKPWITVTPGAVGTNTVTIDRTGLSSGVYSGTITVVTNGGTQTVGIRMTVASATAVPGGDVGVVYVLLVDPTTNDVVAETRTSPADGYAFSFEGVPPGDYDLVAGTDLDDSGIVNDDGEAFGAYPVTSDPRIVHVGTSQTDLNFPLRFQFQVQAASTGRHALKRRFAH